jgi:hypothetical protein
MTDVITEWAPTVGLIGLVFGFLVVLGRHGVPATRRPRLSSLRVRGVLLTAHAGSRHLAQLHARNALPPWDDLDRHFPLHRPGAPTHEVSPKPPRSERG